MKILRPFNGKRMIFSTSCAETTKFLQANQSTSWIPSYVYTHTHTQIIQNGDLNIKAKTRKCLGKYTGVNFYNLGLGKTFLDMTSKTKQ